MGTSTRKLGAALLAVVGVGQAVGLTFYMVHLRQFEYDPQYISPCEQGRQSCQHEAEMAKAKGDDVVWVDGKAKAQSQADLEECLAEYGLSCEKTENIPLAQDSIQMVLLGVASWFLALLGVLGAKVVLAGRTEEAK